MLTQNWEKNEYQYKFAKNITAANLNMLYSIID